MVGSSKIEYIHGGQLQAATYVKNSKAIGFLWGVFSICYAIITVVVFITPQWIGTKAPSAAGYFGLWRRCGIDSIITDTSATTEFICRGRLDDFSSLLNPAFRASTAFVGISMIVAILSVFALILFVCSPTTVAYHIVAWMQTIAAICTGLGILIFPIGWDAIEVKHTCGIEADRFYLGNCTVRWAYVLAIIGLMDGIVLAILGFVLGSRHIKLTDHQSSSGSRKHLTSMSGLTGYGPRGYGYPTDSGPTITPSTMSYTSTAKRSMNMQPIVLMPPLSSDDAYSHSDFSRKAYSHSYSTPNQNFQL